MNPARDAATRIVRTLRDLGHTAYFAGGCVRDELLGLEPADYDVATDATPDEIERAFRSTKSVGKSFGVILVRHDKVVTEVATFREEGAYTDKRRPDEVRFADAKADAQRRDFTINALFLDPLDTGDRAGGRVIDFVDGLDDLERGVVRAVGDPDERLAEDHLRALRAVRFASRFGFPIEERTAGAIRAHARELEGVSRERIGDELRRILAHPNRASGLGLMHALGLDGPAFLYEATPETALRVLSSIPKDADAMLALAAWAVDREIRRDGIFPDEPRIAEITRDLRKALVLANDEIALLRDFLTGAYLLGHKTSWAEAGVAQRKRWGASTWCEGAVALIGAYHPDLAAQIRADIEALAKTPGGLAPTPVVTGDDLVEAGYRPGPRFGEWLDQLYDAQLEGQLSTREEALAWLAGEAGPPPGADS